MKLAIAIANSGTIKTKTFESLFSLVRTLKCSYYLLTQEGSVLHQIRESLVFKAMELKCTHILFIDSDMIFEKDAFERLMKRNKDIVGVVYNMRKNPPQAIQWKAVNKPKGDFYEVEAVPTGFMLINLKVFEKLKHPWFFWEVNTLGETVTGEDFWFCSRAREKGFKVWVDKSLKIGHLGDWIF